MQYKQCGAAGLLCVPRFHDLPVFSPFLQPNYVRRTAHSCNNVSLQRDYLMAKTQPSASRVLITDTSKDLRIVIPCGRSLFVICFLGFWICCWAVAEVMVPAQFLHSDEPSEGRSLMLAWLAVWTVGGVMAIYAWLWQVMGKEIVTVQGQTFTTRRDIGGFGFDKEYNLLQISNLRAEPVGFSPLNVSSALQLWGIGGGVIAFDYGARTYQLGAGLDETEANQVVTAIKKRYRMPESKAT